MTTNQLITFVSSTRQPCHAKGKVKLESLGKKTGRVCTANRPHAIDKDILVRDETFTWYMPGFIINRRYRLFKLTSKMQCTLEYWSPSSKSQWRKALLGAGERTIPEMGRAAEWQLLPGPASINSLIRWQLPHNTSHLWARIMHAWPWGIHEINPAS